MSELKRCPFCGGTPEIVSDYGDVVRCKGCYACKVGDNRESAITQWNKRDCVSAAETLREVFNTLSNERNER